MEVGKHIMKNQNYQQQSSQDIQEGDKIFSQRKLPTINSQPNIQNVTGQQLNKIGFQNQQSLNTSNSITQIRVSDLKQLEKNIEQEKREFLNMTKIKITKSKNPQINIQRGKSQDSNQRNLRQNNVGAQQYNYNQESQFDGDDQFENNQQNESISGVATYRDNAYFYKQRSGSSQKLRNEFNTRTNFATTLKKENYNSISNKTLNSTIGGGVYNLQSDSIKDVNSDQSMNLDNYLKQEGFKSNALLNNYQSGTQQLFISKGSSPQLIYEALPLHIREFFQNKKDFMKSFEEYDLTNKCLYEVNQRVRCYRYELGCLIDKIQNSFYKIYEKTLDLSIKLYNENKKKFETQIKENLANIERQEREKRDIESTNRDLKNRYVVQESLFKITKINHDSLQSEVLLLHDLLKRDILHKINHIGNLENQQNKIFNQKDDPSDKMAQGLNNLNHLISNLQGEQGMKDNMMSQMSGLVKAMLKGSKSDAFTQVDEGELVWLPQEILGNKKKITLPSVLEAEVSSINILNLYSNPMYANKEELNNRTNVEQLKLRENEINQQTSKKGNNMGTDNWNLTINLIVFIENVTKKNENGRVIPWLHFKNLVFEIYEDRIKSNWEINGSMLSTGIPFDEYVCMFFLKQQKQRRLAEIRLFEFLISLRYYMKNHTRAMTFALLCNVSQLSGSSGDNFTFKFDIYIQYFFLFAFKRLNELKKHFIEQDGFTYIPKDYLPELLRDVLIFITEGARQKILTRVGKACLKLNDDQEVIEVDKILDVYLEEYIEGKKKLIRNLTKNYSKIYESDHGMFTIDDLIGVIKESVDSNSQSPSFRFPSITYYTRVFLHSLTSTSNKFDVSPKEFLAACSKFGIDCPFPFIKLSANSDKDDDEEEILRRHKIKTDEQNKEGGENEGKDKQNMQRKKSNKSIGEINQLNGQNNDNLNADTISSKNQIKIDSTSALFAQHFSILREMRLYCKNFKESYSKEEDKEVLWAQFGNILNILEAGCQFLNFPINI
ncbi:hypothetical protein ABPG74_010408 [Tetrahymena malaccensis]